MRFLEKLAVRMVLVVSTLGMVGIACQGSEPDAGVKGGGAGNIRTPIQDDEYMDKHCSEYLGFPATARAGQVAIATSYLYSKESLAGRKCEFPVDMTTGGKQLMVDKQVKCGYVTVDNRPNSRRTGELQLRNLSGDEENPYSILNIYCDTKGLLISGSTIMGQRWLVVKIDDAVAYWPDAFTRVHQAILAAQQGGDDAPASTAGAPAGSGNRKTTVTGEYSNPQLQKYLDRNPEQQLREYLNNEVAEDGTGYATAAQVLRLVYITADYEKNRLFKDIASETMDNLFTQIKKEGLEIEEKRIVRSNFFTV